jgi:hypothetical protein
MGINHDGVRQHVDGAAWNDAPRSVAEWATESGAPGCVWLRSRPIAGGFTREARKGAGPALVLAARPSGSPPPRPPWPSILFRSRWAEHLARHTLWAAQGAMTNGSDGLLAEHGFPLRETPIYLPDIPRTERGKG